MRNTLTLGWFLSAFLLALVGLSMTACDAAPTPRGVPTFAPRPTGTPMPPVAKGSIVKVTRGTLNPSVSARGAVASARQAFLFFSINGILSKLSVAAGDQIKQGELIAQLDAFQLDQEVNAAKLETDRADLQLREVQARLTSWDLRVELMTKANASANDRAAALWKDYQSVAGLGLSHKDALAQYDRYKTAEEALNRTAVDLNSFKTEKQVATLEVEIAQRTLQYAQQKLVAIQTRAQGANLTAPFAGLVISVDKNIGNPVQAFEPIGAIADPTQLQVEVSIPEADMAAVTRGLAARIVLDGFPDQSFTGKVKEIASKASIFQGKSVYSVIVVFDNSAQVPATLRMGADVALNRQSRENVLSVPSKAIQSESARQFVTVLRGDKWERVQVQVGVSGLDLTEILSGVAEGEQVLVP